MRWNNGGIVVPCGLWAKIPNPDCIWRKIAQPNECFEMHFDGIEIEEMAKDGRSSPLTDFYPAVATAFKAYLSLGRPAVTKNWHTPCRLYVSNLVRL